MSRSILRPCFAVALVLALAACSDDSTTPGTGDTTPPAIAALTPIDEYHVNVTFDEDVTRSSAENAEHYALEGAVRASASNADATSRGVGVHPMTAVLMPDQRTVALTTGWSLSGTAFILSVQGVADIVGNQLKTPATQEFVGSTLADVTPPQIVSRSPATDASNVPVGMPVTIQFSEPVDVNTVAWTSPAGPVLFDLRVRNAMYVLVPSSVMQYNELHTISLSGVKDVSGNSLADTEWSFSTTAVVDHVRPTVVAISPANLATRVDVNTALSVTFSEPMNQYTFQVQLDPFENCLFDWTWSSDGRTLTLQLCGPLSEDQSYTFAILPVATIDLAGNHLDKPYQVVFTTGNTLASGGIAGLITGDPGTAAQDPTGAVVLARIEDRTFLANVAANNSYTISPMPDGTYSVLAILDTNHDGRYDLWTGDAIGTYGINLETGDVDEDSVLIQGGSSQNGINFPIYDPSAITGSVSYHGTHANNEYDVYVGLFVASTYNPDHLDPLVRFDAGTESSWYWALNSILDGFPDGDYYVGAFMDVNRDRVFEPGSDPAGMYGGFDSPTVLHAANGSDILDVVIPMVDPPVAASSTAAVAWNETRRNSRLERLYRMIPEGSLKTAP